ncbi:MAG: HlyD family secretion protein [Pseudomonadota bacterium]
MTTTIRICLAVAAVLFVWYLAADRLTPFTGNARIKAVVVPIVPQVSGYVSAVGFTNTRFTEAGETLLTIDQRPFQLQLDEAKAQVELASQDIGASSAEVSIAQANLSRAKTDLDNMKIQTDRIFDLEKKDLVPIARADEARSQLAATQSALAGAEADLLRAQEKLGSEGQDNPQLRAAVAELGEAEINLEWATLKAPARGFVTDITVEQGTYVRAGQPAMTFISSESLWIEAYMTENNLGTVSVGDPVDVVLDVHPGRIFKGVVASFAGAASSGSDATPGQLQSIPRTSGWMRDPQRFPLRISLPGYETATEENDARMMMNGQADIIIYTGGNVILNGIGAFYIRLVGILSYLY